MLVINLYCFDREECLLIVNIFTRFHFIIVSQPRGTGRDRVQNDPTSWLSQIWNYKISKFAQQRSGVVSSLVNEMEWYDETGFYRFLDSAIHGLRA